MPTKPSTTEVMRTGVTRAGYEERAKENAAFRIANRVLHAIDEGGLDIPVKGGPLGIMNTTHEPEVYDRAAEWLAEDGVEIEAHRFSKKVPIDLGVEGYAPPLNRREIRDRITVMSIRGAAVAGAQEIAMDESGFTRESRLYPPEADATDLHNPSMDVPAGPRV